MIMEGQIAKIIIPMLDPQTVTHNQHSFTLTKILPQSQPYLLAANFQPLQRSNISHSTVPRFNADNQHFTQTFILPPDEAFYKSNRQFDKLQFEEHVAAAKQKTIEGNDYKCIPSSKCCQICKCTFNDYLEHISNPEHSRRIPAIRANMFIHQLAETFIPVPLGKKKTIKKEKKETPRNTNQMGNNPNSKRMQTRGDRGGEVELKYNNAQTRLPQTTQVF